MSYKQQPYGYAPVPTASPSVVQVSIPHGIYPGQNFEFFVNGTRMVMQCPPGCGPGQVINVAAPIPQQPPMFSSPPSQPENYSLPSQHQNTAPQTATPAVVDITIPLGIQPGMSFEVAHGSQKLGIQCPPGMYGGQSMKVALPSTPSSKASSPTPLSTTASPSPVIAPVASPVLSPPTPTVSYSPVGDAGVMSYQVAIPKGYIPGQPFQVVVGGKTVQVMCPPNARIGKIIEVMV